MREKEAQGKKAEDVFMDAMKAFSSKAPAVTRPRAMMPLHPLAPDGELWKEAQDVSSMNLASVSYGNEQSMSYTASSLVNQKTQNQ